MNELPKTVTEQLYISQSQWGDVSITACDMTEHGYITLGTETITLDVPQDININQIKIDNLKEQKQKLLAETEVKLNTLEEDIQKLLCIENKS